MNDSRLYFPATEGNRHVIWEVLRAELRPPAQILEIASGSGQHCAHFAALEPAFCWIPSDVDELHRDSIAAWCEDQANVAPPLALDACGAWPQLQVHAVVAINLIHIAPWEATLGLFRGAASVLVTGGFVYLYGAFQRNGGHTAPSNEAFHRSLRAQNPSWGVRHLEEVEAEALKHGFSPAKVVDMPVNNLSVLFYKT